jgi:hypothetical protein
VIGKIYEGKLGEDRFGEIKSFVKESFGKSLNQNIIQS